MRPARRARPRKRRASRRTRRRRGSQRPPRRSRPPTLAHPPPSSPCPRAAVRRSYSRGDIFQNQAGGASAQSVAGPFRRIRTTDRPMDVGLVWRDYFRGWPADVDRRGILVTNFDEQIPFDGFLTSDTILLVERRARYGRCAQGAGALRQHSGRKDHRRGQGQVVPSGGLRGIPPQVIGRGTHRPLCAVPGGSPIVFQEIPLS